MTGFSLFLVLMVLAGKGFTETPCWQLGEGIVRPLPFPSNAEQLHFAAKAQDWVALVHIAPEELAAPTEVRVELFHKGKKKEERSLFLKGRLGQTITATKADGTKVQVGLLGAAVSPDGALIGLLSGLKILVFREEEFLGSVDAGFFPAMVLTPESLLWCPWAHQEGEPLLMRWELDPSIEPEAILLHERKGEVGKKLLAVRSDGLLWLVDVFTGEPWLMREHGTVKQRFSGLRMVGSKKDSGREELEKSLPAEIRDATRLQPELQLFPVHGEPWVSEVYAMGNDLLVLSEKEPDKLYWLADDDRVWRCLQIGSSATDRKAPSLTVTSQGLWISREKGTDFFSIAHLRDLRQRKVGQGESGAAVNPNP